MEYSEFVKDASERGIYGNINMKRVLEIIDSPLTDKKYRLLHHVLSWIWILAFPLGVALIIFANLYLGLISFLFGLILPRFIKESAAKYVLNKALKDEDYFNLLINAEIILVDENE